MREEEIKGIAVLVIVLIIVFAIIYAWIGCKRYEKEMKDRIKTIKVGQIYEWKDPFGSQWDECINIRIDDIQNGWVKYSYSDDSGTISDKCENFINGGWKLKQ